MRATLRSIWTWGAVTLIVIGALPVMALVRLFDRDPAHYHTGRVFRWFGGLASRVNLSWHLKTSGRPPADPRTPYVVVSNHQSLGDVPVISRLPWDMKWVVKEELFSVPIFGWLLRLAGDIPVQRRAKKSRARALVQARAYLQRRCSVMFFPEGTRSRDGRILRFAEGPFRLAIRAGVPVLPLAIDGTLDAIRKNSWVFGTCHAHLKMLDPIPTDGLSVEDAGALRRQVRQQIVEQVAAWRDVAPHTVDAEAADPQQMKTTHEVKTETLPGSSQ